MIAIVQDDLPGPDELVDWGRLVSHMVRIALAFVLALPVAWNRERMDRTAGLRTFPLVAVASCAYVLLAMSLADGDSSVIARILQGLVTGIGFIGGGAILKKDDRASGTATAASIWSMGALGAAVAFDRYEIALVVCLINFATFRFLTPMKEQQGND